ncbi:MAG: hypothetical protein GXP48_04520 [Acidobacteria bacterium]|nr:hypothetical protein [Acidobacteriota bacterium]
MVFFNYALRKLNAKIVYYGPGLCGKTTNLTWIHENFEGNGRGKMISLATEGDRTIFFDLLPLDIGTVRGMDVTLQLYTVPGQVHYNATRQMVLKSADGVVFVADSQRAMLSSNIQSWHNLKENLLLQGIELAGFPHVLQFNKRDLTDILTLEELDETLNEYDAPIFESVATTGVGVQETLEGIIKLVMRNLRNRYDEDAASRRSFAFASAPVSESSPDLRTAPPGGAEIRPFPGLAGDRPPARPVEQGDVSAQGGPAGKEEADAVTHPVVQEPSGQERPASEVTGAAEESAGRQAFEPPVVESVAAAPIEPTESGTLEAAPNEPFGHEMSTGETASAEPEPWAPPASGGEAFVEVAPATGESAVTASQPSAEIPAVFEDSGSAAADTVEPFARERDASPFDLPGPETGPAWTVEEAQDSVFASAAGPELSSAGETAVEGAEEEDLFTTRNIPVRAVDELVAGVVQASTIGLAVEAGPTSEEEPGLALGEEVGKEPGSDETAQPEATPAPVHEATAATDQPAAGSGTVRRPEPVIFGSGDPFPVDGEEPEPALSASASAVVRLSDDQRAQAFGDAIEPSANQLHLTLEGTQALARSGDVRELDIIVPVPGGWIGNRRVTLQLRLTLVPADEEES